MTRAQHTYSAFITGAATGIGQGLVNKLLAEGWRVFAGYRSTDPAASTWYGKDNVIPVKCDVTDPDHIDAAYRLIAKESFDALDLLVNNAAYAGNSGVIEAADMDDYRKTFEVNFWAALQVAKTLMPLLRNAHGKIINTTSASVYLTIPMGSSYPVSKTALKALSHHMRMEMAPFGVQVTSLEPGGVETPMTDLGEEVSASQWASIPEPLRSAYRQHFIDGASAVADNFKLYSPEQFADQVYRKIIAVKQVKPSYLIGPGVAPLPWLHRLLPTQQVLNIWGKMFGV
jgi:NAD(P)-dependent dehydrogenase (short-subunit alcohol dehydrogenase family)